MGILQEMFMFIAMEFIAIPERSDELLTKQNVKPFVEASGSLGLYRYDTKCTRTNPNQTLTNDKYSDWCSNMVKSQSDSAWIQYSIPNKAMKLKGYAVRNGCCYYSCCCDPDTGENLDYYCCCDLYSYSVLGSNDNQTWKTIHKIEKGHFKYCEHKVFEFDLTEAFQYIRFRLDEQRPGCPKCIQLNQVELYGELVESLNPQFDDDETDESISIIGKVKKY